MSDAWDAILPYLVGVLASVITAGASIWVHRNATRQKAESDAKTHELSLTSEMREWQKTLEDRLTKQSGQLEEMQKTIRSQSVRIDRLEGSLRDRDELIEDLVPIAIWVRDGASPPIPVLTWRIIEFLRQRQPTTGKTPAIPRRPPGDSS